MSKTWTATYNVHTYEMDRRQRASIRAICSYLIDTAGQHVHELGYSIPQLLEKDRSWFFSRFLLRMGTYPGWRDTITVETWPPGSQKLLALRDWRLLCGRQLIGLATSGWLMIDIRKRRPLRPESYPDWNRFLHPERTIAHAFGKLPELDPASGQSEQQEFRVRFGDVDINGHANYLSYIDWILESIPAAVRDEREIAEMEVHFLREANLAEDVISRSAAVGDAGIHSIGGDPAEPSTGSEYLHSIVRRQDGTEVVRARTLWRSRPA
jgi:medium-chain acyl-[acyl-carrier-protein] hydrolase